jgi:hypothetical protein
VSATDNRAEVRAAHARLDAAFRAERRQWLRAVVVAAVLTVSCGFFWIGHHVLSEPRLVQGTVSLNRQISAEHGDIMCQVVELDDSRSITVSPVHLAPIGSRVVVSERRTWWGQRTFALVGPAKSQKKR